MKPKNEFVYRKVRLECGGKSDDWIRQGIHEVLALMTRQIKRTNRAPESEQLDRIESTLQALKDELESRGVK